MGLHYMSFQPPRRPGKHDCSGHKQQYPRAGVHLRFPLKPPVRSICAPTNRLLVSSLKRCGAPSCAQAAAGGLRRENRAFSLRIMSPSPFGFSNPRTFSAFRHQFRASRASSYHKGPDAQTQAPRIAGRALRMGSCEQTRSSRKKLSEVRS